MLVELVGYRGVLRQSFFVELYWLIGRCIWGFSTQGSQEFPEFGRICLVGGALHLLGPGRCCFPPDGLGDLVV